MEGIKRQFDRSGALIATAVLVAACATNQPSPSPSAATSPTSSPASSTPSARPSPPPSSETGLVSLQAPANLPLVEASVGRLSATPNGFALVTFVSPASGADPTSTLVVGSADGASWQVLDAAGLGANLDVAVGPSGWLAAADGATQDSGVPGIRLWSSPDGTQWTPIVEPAGLDGAHSGRLFGGASGYALLGQIEDANGTTVGAVWTSVDGRTWKEADTPPDAYIDGAVVLPDGFVAVDSGTSGTTPRAWTSTNRAAWTPQTGEPFGRGVVIVTAVGPDLVAVRTDRTIWRGRVTVDGASLRIAWEHESSADGELDKARVATFAGSASGATIMGWDEQTFEPMTLSSHDGNTWRRTSLPAGTFGGGVTDQLAQGSEAVVAVGYATNDDGFVVPRLWRSSDGVSWEAVAGDALGAVPEAASGPCPSAPPTKVDGYLALDPALWPTCFGDRSLSIRGFVGDCGGCGGATTQQGTPEWLMDPLGYADFWLNPAVVSAESGRGGFGVIIDPKHPVRVPDVNKPVVLTGHFDDPAAATCRLFAGGDAFGTLEPIARTSAWCRQEFVAESIRVVKP